jgi:type II secretory pathway component PulF
VNLRQRIRFYQQLSVLARAGVPLRASLQRLRERLRGRQINVLSEKISAGEQLGDAFAAAGFSPFESHLVAAGERSARLDPVFTHLGEFWSRQRQMQQALVGQLYYPVVVLHLAVIVGALVHLPEGLPAVVTNLVLTLAAFYAGGFVLFVLIRASWQSDAAQRFWLALPVIGKTLSTAYAYRWITALRLEYGAGIPMPDAVADAWRASGYAGRERLAREGQAALREGAELSLLMQHWRQLPSDWVDFIETGEVSGALETAFASLDEEAGCAWSLAQQRMTDWLPKMIYFAILLITGAQIFFAMYHLIVAPINDLNQAVNGILK